MSHRNNSGQIEKLIVPYHNILDLVSLYNRIDVLKLNIEGSEFGLLMEMTPRESDSIIHICVETHFHQIPELSDFPDSVITKHLSKLGYFVEEVMDHIFLAGKSE